MVAYRIFYVLLFWVALLILCNTIKLGLDTRGFWYYFPNPRFWVYVIQNVLVILWFPFGQIPLNLLKDCKALQNISLHGNPISLDQFQQVCSCSQILFILLTHLFFNAIKVLAIIQMDGFQEFEARRKKKFDKQIDSNVMIGSKGLDEGVDLWNASGFSGSTCNKWFWDVHFGELWL